MWAYSVILLQGGGDASGLFCCVGFLVVLVLVIYFSAKSANEAAARQKKALEDAKAAYHGSLKSLKARPRDADLRERTLKLGRAYSNLTRNKSGVTLYDEVALMNDINAACAAAGGTEARTPPTAVPTIEDRLAKLADLRSKGLLDEQEYEARRQKILDEV